MLDKKIVIQQTQCWLDKFIIALNICPFASKERDKGSIRFFVDENSNLANVLENFVLECERLDQNDEIETTLFILGAMAEDFEDYLDFLDIANQLLISQGYEGVYQLASFHPQYMFAESEKDEAANYTNRSPYPMLHIIREESLEKALLTYPNPELIPENNIALCRKMGVEKTQAILSACLASS
ncbi:MAG: DUF1415 domain-containing protein [Proteobacteria bacterium]|nr:DUF1415 domain-containing protein [Pseudomonadota bacterium]